MNAQEKINYLLSDPERLLQVKPFTRGGDLSSIDFYDTDTRIGSTITARLSNIRYHVVTQDQYAAELDPSMHSVVFDDNIPSICVKLRDGQMQDIRMLRTPIPFQNSIMEKQVLHLSAMPMMFTLAEQNPTTAQSTDFITFKHYWQLRNQDGMKIRMVRAAKSYGISGLLYYYDRNGCIKSRLLSYEDGYVLCPHNDDNGDRLLESVYYSSDGVEYIDSYDDSFFYRTTITPDGKWNIEKKPHGFNEIPLITKRTQVAWDKVQGLIEGFEVLYNIFQVLQKRWGWGMLYVKGKISDSAKKIAGNIVLNDVSYEGKGDAKFLEPPSPQNIIHTLENIYDRIQTGSGTTFILPKDIHIGSDTSGVAVKMTMSLDIQTAKNGIVEWQNVADKMVRLFKYGLSKELVAKGIKHDAITEFENVVINASFDVWQPYSESEYNQMLCTMKNAGIISEVTAIEENTVSRPDEVRRRRLELEEQQQLAISSSASTSTSADSDNKSNDNKEPENQQQDEQ